MLLITILSWRPIGDTRPNNPFEEVEGVEATHVVLDSFLLLSELVLSDHLIANTSNIAAARFSYEVILFVFFFGLLVAPAAGVEDTKDAVSHQELLAELHDQILCVATFARLILDGQVEAIEGLERDFGVVEAFESFGVLLVVLVNQEPV